jgi:hypothetical protein
MPPQSKKISGFITAFIFFLAVFMAVAIMTTTANAYSVYAGPQPSTLPSIGNFNLSDLFAPFQSFIHSINSIGNAAPSSNIQPTTVPAFVSVPVNNGVISAIQGAFQQFDNWLYGIVGFHIGGLLVAILNIFSWLLGIVKGAVDWILGLIH